MTIAIAAIVVLAALWIGYWYAASRVAYAALDRVESGPVAGHQVHCANESLGGFPLWLDFRCERPTYGNAAGSITAAWGGLSASAPLYRPGYVAATIDGPLAVNVATPGLALTASWSAATADVSAWLDGLTGGGAKFVSIAVANSNDATVLPAASFRADTAEVGVAPAGGGDYRLSGAATGISLTYPDSLPLPRFDGEAVVTADGVGSTLGTDPAGTLLEWLRTGGTVRIERLRLALGGTVLITSGELTLSPDGLLNGSLLLSYNGIDQLTALFDLIRPGFSERSAFQLQMMNAATKPVQTAEGEFRQTGVVVSNGSLLLLGIVPLPIGPIPAIRF